MDLGHKNTDVFSRRQQYGFSLLELLVVVTTIALLAAIALPMLSDTQSASKIAAAKRQAQQIVAVFTSGLYAGAPSFVSASNVDEALDALGKGDTGKGPLSSLRFHLPGVSAKMDGQRIGKEKSTFYIVWENNTLAYWPMGNSLAAGGVKK